MQKQKIVANIFTFLLIVSFSFRGLGFPRQLGLVRALVPLVYDPNGREEEGRYATRFSA
jgi:hypothetical protein